jgi:membrane protein involved in colicin uptake
VCDCGAAYISCGSLRRHIAQSHGKDHQQQQQQQQEDQQQHQEDQQKQQQQEDQQQQQQEQQEEQEDESRYNEAQHAADCDAVVEFIAEQLQGLSDVGWLASDAEEEDDDEREEQ